MKTLTGPVPRALAVMTTAILAAYLSSVSLALAPSGHAVHAAPPLKIIANIVVHPHGQH